MQMLRAALTGWLVLLPALAVAQEVKIDYDTAFNFSMVKTYSIAIRTTWDNDISERRVLAEFDEALAAQGWKRVAEGDADLQVILHGATRTKRTASTFYSGTRGYRFVGAGSASNVVNEYTVGTLVVDMFDVPTKILVFRGAAEDEISDRPEKNATRLEKASTKMFRDFPPAPRK